MLMPRKVFSYAVLAVSALIFAPNEGHAFSLKDLAKSAAHALVSEAGGRIQETKCQSAYGTCQGIASDHYYQSSEVCYTMSDPDDYAFCFTLTLANFTQESQQCVQMYQQCARGDS